MSKTLEQRFWEKVDKSPGQGPNGDCWLWMAHKNQKGYGFFDNKKSHRVAYELQVGPIPFGLILLHSCDTPGCVRPDHLSPGTYLDNSHDSIKKKRHAHGERTGNAVLTDDMVRSIRKLRSKGLSGLKIAALIGINYRTVYRAANREFWKHVTDEVAS